MLCNDDQKKTENAKNVQPRLQFCWTCVLSAATFSRLFYLELRRKQTAEQKINLVMVHEETQRILPSPTTKIIHPEHVEIYFSGLNW